AAKRALTSAASTLAAKYATFKPRNAASLEPSDLHSLVQPPVNALGNQASTTGRPARSLRRYVRPSDPGSAKSGARSPVFSSTGVSGRCVATLNAPIA